MTSQQAFELYKTVVNGQLARLDETNLSIGGNVDRMMKEIKNIFLEAEKLWENDLKDRIWDDQRSYADTEHIQIKTNKVGRSITNSKYQLL